MLSSNDRAHIELLYNQYQNTIDYIKSIVDEQNWEALATAVLDKEKLVKKIVQFEKTRVEDIKQTPYLLNLKQTLVNNEKKLIEYIECAKQKAIDDLSSVKKTKKILNTYEPETTHIVSTFEIKEDV